eukprot:TRINITY_DN5965_c0_g1_i1.p1 TRINITY_DN5965_c0_g1~~TRINITY_DN5965_c0_g1_i1.p1  ORF type:complete len:280 (+),score=81.83 TRINITY_DN5965_c0_g1_i1:41-841(+)
MPSFMNKEVSAVLLDITGVLIESSGDGKGIPIPGSVTAIQELHKANIPLRFLTNETTKSRSVLYQSLLSHGFDIPEEDHIFTPAIAANAHLRRESLRPFLLAKESVREDLKEILRGEGEPNCVLLGDAEEGFNHAALNKAFQVLMKDTSRKLFTLGKGKYFQQDGNLSLDIGPFAVALEYASEREAQIIGKPDPGFFMDALRSLDVPPERAIMVGDDVRSDVNGSQRAGLRGILVRTGKYRSGDEQHGPDALVDNLKDFVDRLLLK